MTTIDARGLACPLPLTMAKRALAAAAPGESVVVLATDPEAPIDIAAWASEAGHDYSERRGEGWIELELRRGG